MLNKAKEMALFLLRQMGCNESATESQIIDSIQKAIQIYPTDKSELKRHIEAEFKIWVDDFRIIEKAEERKPWLHNKSSSINWRFWNRYRWFLEEKKKLPPASILSVDHLTDRTLDALFDPEGIGGIDKRGMVVGQVQSGKTANYTGLICKAVDAGFKFIIILAGMFKNLRSQTQLRIDEGFLGFDTQHQRAFQRNNLWIGVEEQHSFRHIVAHSLTSSLDNGDFNQGSADALGLNFNTNEPIIAVVKKNARVLERLEQWLSAQTSELYDGRKIIRNKSLLLIDDEADHASINTRKDELQPTTINRQVRSLLRIFEKSAYVGYTATPFANIFIPLNDDNLFPRHFIINLPAPSNYIGPEKIFGFEPFEYRDEIEDTFPIVHRIDDYHTFVPDRHKKDDQLPIQIPDSLKSAIRCFIITCAIRRLRGQTKVHNSMLIHVSRFQRWQHKIKELVESVFDYYRRGIENNIPKILNEMKFTFEHDTINYLSFTSITNKILSSELKDFDPNIQLHEWEDVLFHLNDAASRIQVKEIHGGAADTLSYYDYRDGLSVIVIGGNKLSRGLTLEGLSVSYYLRASRMYDTLMQMGRWFGYRPGYVDLCRLFTSRELNEWFCHITLASEELRKEFDYMSDKAGSTPEQYALRVRTHPGVLQISASNKIRKAVEVEISWAGRLAQTYLLQKNSATIKSNLLTTENLIKSLSEQYTTKGKNYIWFDVNVELIKNFLRNFSVSNELLTASPGNLIRYIDSLISDNELLKWRVAVMSKSRTSKRSEIINHGKEINIGWFERSQEKGTGKDDNYYIRKSNITSRPDEFIDMTQNEYNIYLEKTKKLWKSQNRKRIPDTLSGVIARNEYRKPDKPLLLVYFLDPEKADLPEEKNPIIGFAISFPASDNFESVGFAVHEQLIPHFNFYDEDDDYDE